MADKPKGKWAENVSRYRPGSASARASASKPTRPWHVDSADAEPESEVEDAKPLAWARTLPIASLEADPEQPRRTFDAEALEELASSIREHGVLQPLVVRRGDGGGYVVVAGERRLRAARAAGLAEVPCMVLAGESLREARLAQLAENLQREDLSPIDEARAVTRLGDDEAPSQDDLARRLGKSPAYISRIFAVSRIPSVEYEALSTSKPSMSVLYALAQLPPGSDARTRAVDLIRDGATVRDIEKLRGRARAGKSAGARSPSRRGRPMAASAPVAAMRRAADALERLDDRAISRLGEADRASIAELHARLGRAVARALDDAAVADAVAELERALSRAPASPASKPAGRAGRGGRKAASSRSR